MVPKLWANNRKWHRGSRYSGLSLLWFPHLVEHVGRGQTKSHLSWLLASLGELSSTVSSSKPLNVDSGARLAMCPTVWPWAGDFLFPYLLSYQCNGETTVPHAWDERLHVLGTDGQQLSSLCELRVLKALFTCEVSAL